jgi:TonB family protein
VFLHELAHVQRRDLMWQLAVNAVTAIWWFQPLCWLNRRSLRRECETACDAAVLQSGVRASEYASELLAVAQQIRRRSSYAFAAIAMAEHCDLQRRIRAIVDSEPTRKARRPLTALVILSATTVTLSAVSLAPQIQPKSGGHSMKRTLFSGLLASAGLSAATITGSVYDQNGKVVSNAHVSIVNPDTSVAQETTTTADGKFAFDNLGAGSYILHIDKPQFAGLYREFNVQEDTNVQRGLVLQAAATSATNAVGKTGPVEPIRVRGEVAENNLTNKVTPVYPAAAKQAHVQGTVRLNVTISKEGTPEDIRVVSSPSEDLTKSALEAVRQWRYRPTLLNGEPVEITTDVIVNYTLSQ